MSKKNQISNNTSKTPASNFLEILGLMPQNKSIRQGYCQVCSLTDEASSLLIVGSLAILASRGISIEAIFASAPYDFSVQFVNKVLSIGVPLGEAMIGAGVITTVATAYLNKKNGHNHISSDVKKTPAELIDSPLVWPPPPKYPSP